VSGNAWDAAGAAGFGFRAVWVDRAGQPAEYGLNQQATTVSRLGEVAAALA
jgi:isopentenyl diphosphate isomerase/L-lactate dehydrogenase-like FMN-dependent dehydrogenase